MVQWAGNVTAQRLFAEARGLLAASRAARQAGDLEEAEGLRQLAGVKRESARIMIAEARARRRQPRSTA